MKLATYKDGSRDGQLVVVSRDLTLAHYASGIATRLQQVLDDWNFLSPQLEELSQTLNHGKARHAFPFQASQCLAPLPRAFRWAFARPGDATPYTGIGDELGAAHDDIVWPDTGTLDIAAGLAALCGEIGAGAAADSALEGIRLVTLACDIRLQDAERREALATAFAPVAATPDELGAAWQGGRLGLDLDIHWNGKRVRRIAAGADAGPSLGELLARPVRDRPLKAGGIVGQTIVDAGRVGAEGDASRTLGPGDTLRIEMRDPDGASLFGALDQRVGAADRD